MGDNFGGKCRVCGGTKRRRVTKIDETFEPPVVAVVYEWCDACSLTGRDGDAMTRYEHGMQDLYLEEVEAVNRCR